MIEVRWCGRAAQGAPQRRETFFTARRAQEVPEVPTSPVLYRGMSREALGAAYNNRAAVGRFEEIAADHAARGEALLGALGRGALGGVRRVELPYGDAPRQRLELFARPEPRAPLCVFVHGGYWQATDKEASRFLAAGPLARGFSVALVEYTLAPAATVAEMVREVRAAVAWLAARGGALGFDGEGLFLVGHSAGGHLVMEAHDHPSVRGLLPVSGLFDLEPIRLCYLNDRLGLTAEEARRLSPAAHPPARCAPVAVAVGGGELPELRRQSTEYAARLAAAGVAVELRALGAHDHFSVLEELASPGGALCEELVRMRGALTPTPRVAT